MPSLSDLFKGRDWDEYFGPNGENYARFGKPYSAFDVKTRSGRFWELSGRYMESSEGHNFWRGSRGALAASTSTLGRSWTMGKHVLGEAFFGGLSAVAPVGMRNAASQAIRDAASTTAKAGRWGALIKSIPEPVARLGKGAGRFVSRWLGPAITAYRLGTETRGKGLLGGADAAVRIVGEEVAWGAGAAAGASIGGIIGSSVGPLGTVAGLVIGAGLGYIGAKGWNTMVDAFEAPFKLAKTAWDFLAEEGRSGRRLGLGGQVSFANTTQVAATMRQRALEGINRSVINSRSILGNEAQFCHL